MYRSIYHHVYTRTLLRWPVHGLRDLEVDSWLPHMLRSSSRWALQVYAYRNCHDFEASQNAHENACNSRRIKNMICLTSRPRQPSLSSLPNLDLIHVCTHDFRSGSGGTTPTIKYFKLQHSSFLWCNHYLSTMVPQFSYTFFTSMYTLYDIGLYCSLVRL